MVPISERPKKVVPLFEREKRSCQYLIITLKVVPLYDVNPRKKESSPARVRERGKERHGRIRRGKERIGRRVRKKKRLA